MNHSDFYIELVTRTDELRRTLEADPVMIDAVANGMSALRYRKLLGELYHIVWHFNPICAAAASRMTDEYKTVRYFLYKHMEEESGHESWVLNDLAAIGTPQEQARALVPSPDALLLTSYNYMAAERGHPCSVLGMLYALEVVASVYGGSFATAIKESLFLEGEAGVSFIGSHAEMDAKHLAQLRGVLNTVGAVHVQEAIIQSASLNYQQLTRIVAAI